MKIFRCVFILLLLGCNRAPKAREFKEACELYSKKTAESVLGATVKDPDSKRQGGQAAGAKITHCTYISEKGFLTTSLMVRYASQSESSKNPYQDHVDSIKRTMGDEVKFSDVPGLGYPAGWVDSMKQLTLFIGNDMLIISAPNLDASKKAAREIIKDF